MKKKFALAFALFASLSIAACTPPSSTTSSAGQASSSGNGGGNSSQTSVDTREECSVVFLTGIDLTLDTATVKKGDVILVLEAMKMDNDITAEADGVISFNVKKGENVETDAVMAVIG